MTQLLLFFSFAFLVFFFFWNQAHVKKRKEKKHANHFYEGKQTGTCIWNRDLQKTHGPRLALDPTRLDGLKPDPSPSGPSPF